MDSSAGVSQVEQAGLDDSLKAADEGVAGVKGDGQISVLNHQLDKGILNWSERGRKKSREGQCL